MIASLVVALFIAAYLGLLLLRGVGREVDRSDRDWDDDDAA